MRTSYALMVILFLIFGEANAQTDTINKMNISSGVGYFADVIQFLQPGFDEPEYVKVNPAVVGKIYNGSNIWVRFGYNLPTGYIISGYYSMAVTSYHMNDPLGLYWNELQTDRYMIANVMFSWELGKKKNRFLPGAGILYRKYSQQDITYSITPVFDSENKLIDVQMGLPYPSNIEMNDLGLVLGLDYKHVIKNKMFIGLSISTNMIFDIGFETISLSPFIGCSF